VIPAGRAASHDIPNARVDRSIQVIVEPGRLLIEYDVSLSELTLTQELRSLVGPLPQTSPRGWFEAYGRETGPLNAKGLLVSLDDRPVELGVGGFSLTVEQHPRYTFHITATLPETGRLAVHDTNFATSEGTSRLAVRGRGVEVHAAGIPEDVETIQPRPVWQLSDEEERRTKEVEFSFRPLLASLTPSLTSSSKEPSVQVRAAPSSSVQPRLPHLLDPDRGLGPLVAALTAMTLGAAHAVQPGHGKTLVAATVVADGGQWLRGALLAVVTTLTHTGSVLLVAAGLWLSKTSEFRAIDDVLARAAGFVIAAIGSWRLGRHLAGHSDHASEAAYPNALPDRRGIVSLGLAAGLVPCWDAVGLIVLAAAVGRIALGVWLVLAFSLGMGAVLVAVGWAASRARRLLFREGTGPAWEHRLGAASGLILLLAGGYLLWR
jgi:ABC-type nickel/cobalt efflux system permease component RcnA